MRGSAAYALGKMGRAGAAHVEAVAALLTTEAAERKASFSHDYEALVVAADALGKMGEAGAAYADAVAALLTDPVVCGDVRRSAARVLSKMGKAGAAHADGVAALRTPVNNFE